VHPAGPHQAGLFLCRFATFLSKLIETFFIQDVSKSKAQALKYSGFFYAMAAGFFCAALVQGYMFAVVGSRLSLRVRKLFFEAVLHMEMGWFDKDENSSGSLTSRLSADAPSIRGATGDVLGVVTQNLVTLIVGACCTAIDHDTSRTERSCCSGGRGLLAPFQGDCLRAGLTIAFVHGWLMTLVVLATLPLLGFSSYMQMKFFTGMPDSTRCQYSGKC
jgi:ATP-binding cassette, subfamily B (MDR/TAP), member 1